jgi:hypothetical protein
MKAMTRFTLIAALVLTLLGAAHLANAQSRSRTPISPPYATYRITIKTGNVEDAGTDANVWMTFSPLGSYASDSHELYDPYRDDFEKGQSDEFYVNDYDRPNHADLA